MSHNGHVGSIRALLPWRRRHMDIRVVGPTLTAREREVARCIGLGLTNRQIAKELGISDRTVGAHVQNILNKLGATNRAQIATWSAQRVDALTVRAGPAAPAAPAPLAPIAVQRSPALAPATQAALLAMAALLFTFLFPADHVIATPADVAALSGQRGDLVYDARFDPDGHEFSLPYVLGDPTAVSVRIRKGGIEYSVLKGGGNTGSSPALGPLPAYYADFEVSVKPGSNIQFWISFSQDDSSIVGQHLLDIDTAIETMQLGYFNGGENPMLPLGPQVPIDGLQKGRTFVISALVEPPLFRVFLDGAHVIEVTHASPRAHLVPGFAVFGDGTGTVRLTAIRIYKVR
jgi:DNA-binding CsgD family transcriptional regulator